MKENKCRVCGTELSDENWYPSYQKGGHYVCKGCSSERTRLWREANPEGARAITRRARRKRGERPFNENKECTMFLGVHIAERVLSKVFKDVKRMPMHNPGYDFICNHGKEIDVKSSCLQRNGSGWMFTIDHNTTADYFLCLAFDNRENLTPMHVWLIPGNVVSHLKNTSIRPSTIHKWDAYKLDISKIYDCCNTLKAG